MTGSRNAAAGFSLVEVLVALAIFALIGTAGFTMLDQVMRTQRQTEGRLERLADLQRAAHLIRIDFTQAGGASLEFDNDTTPASLRFLRPNSGVIMQPVEVSYVWHENVLQRVVTRTNDANDAIQPLLHEVTEARWQFFDGLTGGWIDQWPPTDRQTLPGQPRPNPSAVELTVTLEGSQEQLRRVVLLPAEFQ